MTNRMYDMKHNFVAKHARKFNKTVVFKDKKKALKRGEYKHKKHTAPVKSERYQIAA